MSFVSKGGRLSCTALLGCVGNGIDETISGLEGGNVVLGDDNGGVLLDVASCLLGTLLDIEATETAEVNCFLVHERTLNGFHECFYSSEDSGGVDSGLFGNLLYNFCFCHCCVMCTFANLFLSLLLSFQKASAKLSIIFQFYKVFALFFLKISLFITLFNVHRCFLAMFCNY